MKKIYIPLILSLLFSPLYSQDISNLVNLSREAHYRSDIMEGRRLSPLIGESLKSLNPSSEEDVKTQVELYLYGGLLALDQGEEDKGESLLETGISLSAEAFETYGSEYFLSRGALLKSHWMLLQKTGVLIKSGGEIQNMTDQALEMDPQSTTALLLSAQGLINAPALFGGDPDKAAVLLEESGHLKRESYEEFDLYLTLADALRLKKKWEEAQKWCSKALILYPGNQKALNMQENIKNRKKS